MNSEKIKESCLLSLKSTLDLGFKLKSLKKSRRITSRYGERAPSPSNRSVRARYRSLFDMIA